MRLRVFPLTLLIAVAGWDSPTEVTTGCSVSATRRTTRVLLGCVTTWLWVAALSVPATSLAQSKTAQMGAELSRTVRPGDEIFVTDRTGVQTGGRVLHLSPEELTLLVDKQERVIPSSGIGRIEKRDSFWNGMLIGAVPAALIGAGVAGFECSPHCSRDVPLGMLVYGAIGTGIGALIDASVRGYAVVDGPPLGPPNALTDPAPVTSLDDLWMRVRQGDTVHVVTPSGQHVKGKFIQVSDAFVTLRISGKNRQIPSSDVLRVTRAGNRHRSGALAGAAIFGTLGLVSSAACSGSGCGNPLGVAMAMGSVGALWGAVIGAAIPKHPTVYESAAGPTVRVTSMIGAGRVGVAVSATF
jgi:hypothetical protein